MAQKKLSDIVKRFQQLGVNVTIVSPRTKIMTLLLNEQKKEDYQQEKFLFEIY